MDSAPRCEKCGSQQHSTNDCHRRCYLCGSDGHLASHCDRRWRHRVCYFCRLPGHRIGDCPERRAAEQQQQEGHEQRDVTFRVRFDAEPPTANLVVGNEPAELPGDGGPPEDYVVHEFQELELVEQEDYADNDLVVQCESSEGLVWSAEGSRKRRASPRPGPSWRMDSPEPVPMKRLWSLDEHKLFYADTHFHPDLMCCKNVRQHEWRDSGEFPFGGGIADFAYPSVWYRQAEGILKGRRMTVEGLLSNRDLLPAGAVKGIAVGCHPKNADEFPDVVFEALRDVFSDARDLKESDIRPVAVGEAGLDQSDKDGNNLPLEVQVKAFDGQIWVANEFGVPLLLHVRNSSARNDELDDIALVLLAEGLVDKGQYHGLHRHCFLQPFAVAEKWIRAFPKTMFGFTRGIIEPRDSFVTQAVAQIPLEHIVLETDSSYFGDHGRRTPRNALSVAQEIAKVKNISLERVVQQTTFNAEALYGVEFSN